MPKLFFNFLMFFFVQTRSGKDDYSNRTVGKHNARKCDVTTEKLQSTNQKHSKLDEFVIFVGLD